MKAQKTKNSCLTLALTLGFFSFWWSVFYMDKTRIDLAFIVLIIMQLAIFVSLMIFTYNDKYRREDQIINAFSYYMTIQEKERLIHYLKENYAEYWEYIKERK